jgi:hypothetical protein
VADSKERLITCRIDTSTSESCSANNLQRVFPARPAPIQESLSELLALSKA